MMGEPPLEGFLTMDHSDLDLLPLTSVVSPAPVTVPVRQSSDPTVSTFAGTYNEVAMYLGYSLLTTYVTDELL